MSSTVVPTLRYRDAHCMIGWLCEVFGFARHAVYEDGQGGIAHAQLTLGSGMIMLGSARDDEFGRLQSTPAALGGGLPQEQGIAAMQKINAAILNPLFLFLFFGTAAASAISVASHLAGATRVVAAHRRLFLPSR